MEEDIEDREDTTAEIMTNGLISFQKFLKEFKQVVKDDVIEKINNRFEISYNFRKFNLECYIIDKKYYDEFCKAINYKEISKVLSIINEENTEKCKQMIKEKLKEDNFNINVNDIEFYADQEGLKKIVGHFNNYSFLNKELLVDCMGVPEEKLKSKKIFVSKNEKNTTLLNVEENFTMSINIVKKDAENKEEEKKEVEKKVEIKKEEKKVQIKKKPKNLYYVEDITKKIFLLLYKKDELINKKIEKNSKDSYKFKNYYLISKDWLKLYKQQFLYDQIISKIDEELKTHSYKRIKTELDSIIKDKIGQIKIYGSSEIEPGLREASKLLPSIKPINKNKDNNNDNDRSASIKEETLEPEQDITQLYEIPSEFEIINEDIYELLKKEEFLENFNEKIENQLCYEILFGNNQIIIKNKASENFEEKDDYSNELLFYEKNEKKENNNDDYILQYILNFEKKVNFYEEIGKIFKDGLKYYIESKKLDLEKMNIDQKIVDKNSNILGKFFNININMEKINKYNNEIQKKDRDNKVDENEIIINNDINTINEIRNNDINIKNKQNKDDIIINVNNEGKNEIIEDNIAENKNKLKNDIDNNKDSKKEMKSKLKKIFGNIFKIFDNISKNVTYNFNNQQNLGIKGLSSEELEYKISKNENSPNIKKIILMNEDEYKNYEKKYYIDEIRNIIEKKEKTENKNILLDNQEKILSFYSFFEVKEKKLLLTSDIFELNDYDYKLCLNYINKKKKFLLLNSSDIKFNSKNSIYYFLHDCVPYIYFRKDKQFLKVEKEKQLCNLSICVDNRIIDEYLKVLKKIMTDNKKEDVFFDNYKQKNEINEYYLINNKWLDSKIKKKNENYKVNDNIKPKFENNGFQYSYPSNFFIVINDDKNQIMMHTLIKHYNINLENIKLYKISIINADPKDKFICVIIVHVAYFYKIKNKEFHLYFYIDFKDKDILEKEIKEKICLLGLIPYINFMIMNNNFPSNLYDVDLKEVGKLFKVEEKSISFESNEYFKIKLENIKEEYIKIRSLLVCLLNIEEIREFSPVGKKLDDTLLFSFCQLLRAIRKNNLYFLKKIIIPSIKEKVSNEYENVLYTFVVQMTKLSNEENKNIFDDLNILIKLLILQIQKDIFKSEKQREFNYTDAALPTENLLSEQNSNSKTFIENCFFFNIEISKNCGCPTTYEYKYFLRFDLNDIDKGQIDILSIFKKINESKKCDCQKDVIITKKLINLPKYLILVINSSKKITLTKFNEAQIDIKDFSNNKKDTKYELISFINKVFEPFNKSTKENKWYKYVYNSDKDNKFTLPKTIELPILLIYKQLKQL